MTKWDYMVVHVNGPNVRTTSGKVLSGDKWYEHNRHIGLKELGEKGWELIKIRGNGSLEYLYFKRPL